MNYYSEDSLEGLPIYYKNKIKSRAHPIHVRLCRDCEYFVPDLPTIDVDGDFGCCEYRTDFAVFDDTPINWYFTDINGFCNEDDIK